MSDTKKLASPFFFYRNFQTQPVSDIEVMSGGCDASSAQFCTHYYYLKLAFQQTVSAPIIGLTSKEFVLFIPFGLFRLAQQGKSRNGPEKLNPFRQPL